MEELFFKKIIFTDFYKASLENNSSFQLRDAIYKIPALIFIIAIKFCCLQFFFRQVTIKSR
jgi:hypothetical protein